MTTRKRFLATCVSIALLLGFRVWVDALGVADTCGLMLWVCLPRG